MNVQEKHAAAEKAKREKQEAELNRLAETYAAVFGGEDGKKIIDDLTARCHLLSAVRTDDIGPLQYVEGRRSILCHILAMLKRASREETPRIELPL